MAINWTNVTTAYDWLNSANTTTGGYFWGAMLWLVIGILVIAFIPLGIEIALMTSLFIGILGGMMLFYAGLINELTLGIIVTLEIFIIIYTAFTSNKTN